MTQLQRLFRVALAAAVFTLSACSALAETCVDTQYGDIAQGNYMIQNDEWGLSDDTGGWEQICTGSTTNNSWSATWWWAQGTSKIKAYPSMYRGWQYGTWSPDAGGFPVQISTQPPLPTSVAFDMTGDNQYDDAYDIFFSPSTNPSSPSAEMMIWLNYSGNQPAGSKIASAISLGGVSGTWDVWSGNNGWPVWTFVRTSQVSSFSSNLQPFVYYLAYTTSQLDSSWYVLNIQFGTEIIYSHGANGSLNVTSFSASAQ